MAVPKFRVKFSGRSSLLGKELLFQISFRRWICEVGRIDSESKFSFELELQGVTIFKFKYYGIRFNVKKIKADDKQRISIHRLKYRDHYSYRIL